LKEGGETMAKPIQRKEVCVCEKCGNEAEMVVTCEWVPVGQEEQKAGVEARAKERKTFTCVNCGNEADITVDA
jgi:hypothetical protein